MKMKFITSSMPFQVSLDLTCLASLGLALNGLCVYNFVLAVLNYIVKKGLLHCQSYMNAFWSCIAKAPFNAYLYV